jgi:hypothetical protein
MLRRIFQSFQRPTGALLAAALLLAMPGCASWNLRGEGFHDPDEGAFNRFRPAESEPTSSLSEKAREIERSFGYGR